MDKKTYDDKISEHLRRWSIMNKPRLLWAILGFIALHLLLYVLWSLDGGRDYATQQLLQWLPEIIVFDVVGGVIAYVYIAWHEIPKAIHDEQERNLEKLESEIKELTETLIDYDGLKIEKDTDDAYITQYVRVGGKLAHEIKLWVIVHNSDLPVYDCVIDLENMEYTGRYSNNEWVDSPSGFDRKALKWDVGYLPDEGRIDISARTRKRLEIAVSFPHPMATMELSHLDGYSKRGHLLDGVYRVTIRVDGKVFVKEMKKDIKPRWYEVGFDYQHHSAVLKLLEINEYEPRKDEI